MRILAAQPESMGSSKTGTLTLRPMGQKGVGDTCCLIISLILDQSAYSKQVNCSIHCIEWHH